MNIERQRLEQPLNREHRTWNIEHGTWNNGTMLNAEGYEHTYPCGSIIRLRLDG